MSADQQLAFSHDVGGIPVVFGRGSSLSLGSVLQQKVVGSTKKLLMLCSARGKPVAEQVAEALPDDGAIESVLILTEVVEHVPSELVDTVLPVIDEHGVDIIVAIGGGSAIGLAKALCLRSGCKYVAIPTTYSGSEMTDIVGITEGGKKVTARDPKLKAKAVLYDADLSESLPAPVSITSAFNAMAHAVEALWSREADPITRLTAQEAIRVLAEALPGLPETESVPEARAVVRDQLLYGAHLCGIALQKSKMGLHHKLAHVLGGSFNLPHAKVHTILLPFSVYFNREHAPDAMAKLQQALGADDAAAALFDLIRKLGAPYALRQLAFTPKDIDTATELIADPARLALYSNPRPIEADAVADLLLDAFHGRRPTSDAIRSMDFLDEANGAHAAVSTTLRGCSLETASAVVVCIQGRYSSADRMIQMVQDALGSFWRSDRLAFVAPQAVESTWYPGAFTKPLDENEPRLSSALSVVGSVLSKVQQTVPASQIVLVGFSQGACLALSYVAKFGAGGIAAMLAFSGGLCGSDEELATCYGGDVAGLRVYMGCAKEDGHVSADRLNKTAEQLQAMGAEVEEMYFEGSEHKIFPDEARALRSTLEPLVTNPVGADLFEYLYGLGSPFTSEARPGAVPIKQNSPRSVPYGLYAEMLNGSSFVAPRHENFRAWFYRIHPSVAGHTEFKTVTTNPRFTSDFSSFTLTPEPMRWKAAPAAADADGAAPKKDFVDGIWTIAGSGSPLQRCGMAIHGFACNASMEDRSFYNADGCMCVVLNRGELIVTTEYGRLHVRVGEIFVIQRGMKFSVHLLGSDARGWITEVFGSHFKLPDRGLVGSNGLADARHIAVPTAWYEDRACQGYRLTAKFGGSLHEATLEHSPYDVVGWHGSYVPYKYNLFMFNAFGSVTWDHTDPSMHVVIHSLADDHGNSACDVAAFVPRWDATLHTFRPPYYHRNQATEFNGIVSMNGPYSGFEAGGSFLTPFFTAHGIATAGAQRSLEGNEDAVHLSPDESSVWIMFESCYPLTVAPWAVDAEYRDRGYRDIYKGSPRRHTDRRDAGAGAGAGADVEEDGEFAEMAAALEATSSQDPAAPAPT